jgi:hypothetical protein
MESCDNIFDKIHELLGSIQGNVSILEEQIDADIQTAYYDYARNLKKPVDREEILKNRETIFQTGMCEEDRKQMLVQLASIDSIEAYRTLEKYMVSKEKPLSDWATLAFKESRLLIESKLLDESQILISTGLGGKGLRLRYFTVLISKELRAFTLFEQKVITDELKYVISKHGGISEEVNFDRELCTILSIIPLKAPVQGLFDALVEECNLYGNFIASDYIITNVRIIENKEIRKMINYNNRKK